MPTDLNKRAARLAMTRFGADSRGVREAYRAALEARERGWPVDFVEDLVNAKLISAVQAAELREALDKTRIDARGPAVPQPNETPAAASNDPPPSEIGQYRILRKIGEGGMGAVYLAYDETEQRQVAIKVLASNLAANPLLVQRFEREAHNSAQLHHPNIVRGLNVGKDETTGRHYLVMEFVDGPSAQALLDQLGRLPIGDAVHIGQSIARALEHAHARRIVHRDIKPENILITRTGIAKLADLGLAKQMGQVSHLTATRQGFGTPYYMPYEQAINAKQADHRSDIYALGATLYHLLTGQPPFMGETLMEILEKKEAGSYLPASLAQPEVSDILSRILDKMLAFSPEDRYQTASEVIVELERSGLAADVPSFVDRELALQDPQVRAQAAGAQQTTQLDFKAAPRPGIEATPKRWFVRYRDHRGQLCQAKLTTEEVLQRIRTGSLTNLAEASPSPKGPFRRLDAYPAFYDLLVKLDGVAASSWKPGQEVATRVALWSRPATWWLLIGGLIAAGLLALALIYWLTP